ncbi:hypothetical protein J699_03424 [Acinetobacter sp. 1000160]|nr:hypothetical protein J522_2754 [Acinetobacter baumannii 146457]EYT15331.1 hypothetical protein J699_03424 [Acinetobacter sp. 1000160]
MTGIFVNSLAQGKLFVFNSRTSDYSLTLSQYRKMDFKKNKLNIL